MRDERWRLPKGWVWAQASDIAQVIGGGTPPSKVESNFLTNGIPWITPADLTGYALPYICNGRRDLSPQGYINSGAKLMPKGSVLFSSRAPIGYCAIADNELCTSQGFKSLVLREGMLPEFVRYYLLSAKEYAESLASGTTFLELSASRMASLQIPVAPISEQRRVVNEINISFTRIAEARSDLLKIEPLLRYYKKRLLQSADDGSMIGAQGVTQLMLSEIVESLSYGTSKKSHIGAKGTPVLRIPNVSNGKIDFTDLKYCEFDRREYEKLRLKIGDLLVVRSNGSPSLVGLPAVVGKEAAEMAYAGYLIRIRPLANVVNPQYLAYMLQSPRSRALIENQVTSTSGIHNVNAKQLAELLIPVPSIDQQDEVVQRLDTALSWLSKVSEETIKSIEMLTKLQSSILVRAFKARDDEPLTTAAESQEILARIKKSLQPDLPKVPQNAQDISMNDEAPKSRLITDSLGWPDHGLAFEEVVKRVPLERDQMRDAIFEILREKDSELMQSFDPIEGRMLLKRSPK